MKKITILFLLLAGFTFTSYSQDIIIKTDGSTIKCKVVEVGLDVIKYKRLDNLSGPDYFIERASIAEIQYENGTKDTFAPIRKDNNAVKRYKAISQQRRGYISLSLGPAFPVGDFGSGDLNNPKAGLAKTGFQFNLVNFGYRFSGNIGIAALWNGAAHTIQHIDDGVWSYGYMLGGLLVTFPSERIDFDIRIMGGLMNATVRIPSLNFEVSGLAFGWDVGGVIRLHLGRVISFIFTTDYSAGKPTLRSGNSQGFEQSISAVNFTGGIAFRIK
jgi:hypothetical protein